MDRYIRSVTPCYEKIGHTAKAKDKPNRQPFVSYCPKLPSGMVVDHVLHEQAGEIEMEKNNYLDLLTSVDVLNTINGGRTEPVVALKQHNNYREIRVRIPGIVPASIEVEVNDNIVSIYYVMNIYSTDKLVKFPYSVYNRKQPYFVDVSRIQASVEDKELVVKLPFNKLANGYFKKIKKREG